MKTVTVFTLIALFSLSSGSLFADLIDPGFESGGLSNWAPFGQGWRIGGGGDANTGASGAVNDVLTSDADEFRGIAQTMAVVAGTEYTGGVFIRAVNLESSESWFELQWLDSGGGTLSQVQSPKVTSDQPFTFMTVGTVTAPVGAESVSVRGIVHMTSAPAGDTDFHIFDDFSMTAVVPEPNVLSLVVAGGFVLLTLSRRWLA